MAIAQSVHHCECTLWLDTRLLRAGTLPTVQAELLESEAGLIHKPRPMPYVQVGDESVPITHLHVSMLYWRLGLCESDKFEGLALGAQLNKYISGLRTEYVHRRPPRAARSLRAPRLAHSSLCASSGWRIRIRAFWR